MNSNYALFSIVLIIACIMPVFGQHTHTEKASTLRTKYTMSVKMGTPTFAATVEGIHMKVWLMTQSEHEIMMKGKMGEMMDIDMKGSEHEGMEMGKPTEEMMMRGTHYIMLDVTDATTKKRISTESTKVLILSPSKKEYSIDLMNFMHHFGSGLSLDERGDYQFTMRVTAEGVSKTTQFSYSVK